MGDSGKDGGTQALGGKGGAAAAAQADRGEPRRDRQEGCAEEMEFEIGSRITRQFDTGDQEVEQLGSVVRALR
jgi:hypothetical protein